MQIPRTVRNIATAASLAAAPIAHSKPAMAQASVELSKLSQPTGETVQSLIAQDLRVQKIQQACAEANKTPGVVCMSDQQASNRGVINGICGMGFAGLLMGLVKFFARTPKKI